MISDKIALSLTIVGGLNWGFVGAFNFDLVKFLFDFAPILVAAVYIIIGISACYTTYAYLIK